MVELSTFIVQLVLLITILGILKKFVVAPYVVFLDEEAVKQKKLEEWHWKIQKMIEEANAERAHIIKDAKKEADEMVDDAKKTWDRKKSEIIDSAENEAKVILTTAEEKSKTSMLNTAKTEIIWLVLKLNGKLFEKENLNKEFVEKEIESLQA